MNIFAALSRRESWRRLVPSLFALLGYITLIAGCSDKVTYHPGLVTDRIEGKIILDSNSKQEQPFILVRKHNRTLIETSDGYLHRISASIVHPNKDGFYTIDFETAVDRMDLMFLARGFQTNYFSFRRTLGIGKYEYNVGLEEDPNWKDTFFLLIKPTLSEYITEQRYRMKNYDQLFIGNWISEIEKGL
ncbi:MAG: hypothetical protein GY866_05585 [Proteobacteria bacterium]|nr:hypothetical protein [Pseudomonadota bacterium]